MIHSNGRVFFDSEKNIAQMDNHLTRPEVNLAKSNGIGSAVQYSKTLNKTLVYVAKKTNTNQISKSRNRLIMLTELRD